MELTVWDDDLKPERQNYQNRFQLKIKDFLPEVQDVINLVHLTENGRVTFRVFGRPQDYSAIVE